MKSSVLFLLLFTAGCTVEPADESSVVRNLSPAIWPESERTNVVNELGLQSPSQLGIDIVSGRAALAGGELYPPELTGSHLTCLSDLGRRSADHALKKFGFAKFAGPRPASITFAFEAGTGKLICADVFRPKE